MEPIQQAFADLRAFPTPPLHRWRPRECLDIGLRIGADGQWHYRGSPIQRRRMVKLFASVLRVEADGKHYLITPQLKYPVTVDDAPFQAVEVSRRGEGKRQNLLFRTNVDDVVLADRNHPLRITDAGGQVSPTVEVRDGLRAKLSRPVYYELAQFVEPATSADGGEVFGLYSGGEFFSFGGLGLLKE